MRDLERLGTTDNFNKFFGNRSLTGPVVVEGERINQLSRVSRRGIHGRHAAGLFTGLGFQEGLKDLCSQRHGKEMAQDFSSIGLIDEVATFGVLVFIQDHGENL